MNGWNFPGNNFGQTIGISEAGIETFKGLPTASLAREVCQNSLDAIDDKSKPVYMEFQKTTVSYDRIPGFEGLNDALHKCYDYGIEQSNKKTIKFFEKSLESIKDKVSVLRISDYNTKGLQGSDKDYGDSPWRNLVKSNGVSNKEGSSGGSFGIGKSASFACSSIRTIFYRTLDKEGITAAQGISKLISFKKECDQTGDMTTGTGYFGEMFRNKAVKKIDLLDEINIRDKYGTDIFIFGFDGGENWGIDIITELLESFLISFYKGLLVVKVGDVIIDDQNLSKLINNYPVDYVKSYYRVLTDSESKEIEDDFDNMGTLTLSVLLKDDLNRRVLISRTNGMKLFDKDRISGSIQFSAILMMKGEILNSYFRLMESPQHNRWEPERYEERKGEAKKKISMLTSWVKEKIQELAIGENEDEVDAEGVGELIPDLIDNKYNNGSKKEESITDTVKDWEFKMSERKPLKNEESEYGSIKEKEIIEFGDFDDKGEYEGEKLPRGKSNNGDSGNIVTGKISQYDGNIPILGYKEVKKYKMRLFASDNGERKYTLLIQPDKDYSNCYIGVRIAGEQSNININVLNAKFNDIYDLKCKDNIIYLKDVNYNSRNKIVFKLDDEELYSLEVKLYES